MNSEAKDNPKTGEERSSDGRTSALLAGSYNIITLRDIFELPTLDMMQRCLTELSAVMVATRATSELWLACAKAEANGALDALPDKPIHRWPEVAVWRDDKGVDSTITLGSPGTGGDLKLSLTHRQDGPKDAR